MNDVFLRPHYFGVARAGKLNVEITAADCAESETILVVNNGGSNGPINGHEFVERLLNVHGLRGGTVRIRLRTVG